MSSKGILWDGCKRGPFWEGSPILDVFWRQMAFFGPQIVRNAHSEIFSQVNFRSKHVQVILAIRTSKMGGLLRILTFFCSKCGKY